MRCLRAGLSHPQTALSVGITLTYRLLLAPSLSLVAMESDVMLDNKAAVSVLVRVPFH